MNLWVRSWTAAGIAVLALTSIPEIYAVVQPSGVANADVCASVGRRVSVSGPSDRAMRRARDRIRELTHRSQLLLPVEVVVADLNRFLRGWAGYFRYGHSAAHFHKTSSNARHRLELFLGKRHQRGTRLRLVRHELQIGELLRAMEPVRNRHHTRAAQALAGQTECRHPESHTYIGGTDSSPRD